VAERVKDLYFRYNASHLTDATAITLTLTIERSTSYQPYRQTNILYATFRNRI